jgi:hypothetical protein
VPAIDKLAWAQKFTLGDRNNNGFHPASTPCAAGAAVFTETAGALRGVQGAS